MKLSDTQRQILLEAAQHPRRLAVPPERLPAGARQMLGKALLKAGLVAQVQRPTNDAVALWTIDGTSVLLGLMDTGCSTVGLNVAEGAHGAPQVAEEGEPRHKGQQAPQSALAPSKAPREGLRKSAAAVLAAWSNEATRSPDIIAALNGPMQRLRAVLAGKPPREANAPRQLRHGTKQEAVLALLRRPDGATIAQVMEATGWQQHTVRGFLAGFKKCQGIEVAVLERIRQVGPNKTGAKGSYSIYRIGEAG